MKSLSRHQALGRRNSCLYLLMRALRRAPVFLCKTPLATALSTTLVASEINDSKPLTSSSVRGRSHGLALLRRKPSSSAW